MLDPFLTLDVLIPVWVVIWTITGVLASILIASGIRQRDALRLNGEQRRSYHVWAGESLRRRYLALAICLVMVVLGIWRLYAQIVYPDIERRTMHLRDNHYAQWLYLSLFIIGPLFMAKLLSEVRAERIVLAGGESRGWWKFWRW